MKLRTSIHERDEYGSAVERNSRLTVSPRGIPRCRTIQHNFIFYSRSYVIAKLFLNYYFDKFR